MHFCWADRGRNCSRLMWLEGVIARLTTFLALQLRKTLLGLWGKLRDLTLTCIPDRLSSNSWIWTSWPEAEVGVRW